MNKRTLLAFGLGASLSLAAVSSLVSEPEPALPAGWYGAASFAPGSAFAPSAPTVQDLMWIQHVVGTGAALQGGGLGHAGAAAPRDRFWSTGFSAGNHDPASGAGYVGVPGHGPVGYGM